MRLGLTAGSPQAFAARNEHWATISIQLILFIAGGISTLALAIADYRRERDADSLFLLLWVVGTFWFTAYLNWTVNARSILPMVPAVGILLARRLEKRSTNPTRQFKALFVVGLLACGVVSLWLARADTDAANSARTAASLVHQKTAGNYRVWFLGHSGFQYYMQMLGARPYDWSHPQSKPGDFLAIPYSKVWPEDVTLNSMAHEKILSCRCTATRAQLHLRSAPASIIPTGRYCLSRSGRFPRKNTQSSGSRNELPLHSISTADNGFLDLARFPPT